MASSITTGINFDTPTLESVDAVCDEIRISRSRFVQLACRTQLKLYRKQNAREILDNLDPKELEALKELIKGGF